MRVAVLVHLFPPDHNAGAEWMLVSMLRPLVDRGHHVTVVLSRQTARTQPYEMFGMTVMPRSSKHEVVRTVAGADVVVTHLENTIRAAALAKVYRKPLCVVMHNTHALTRSWLASYRPDLAVYNSEWMRDEFAGIPIPHGIVVRPPVFAADYRTTPGDRITLINLNADKGGRLLWEIAARMPDLRFLAVKGAYGEQIVGKARNVKVIGHMSGCTMRDVYARTRILLVPSVYESWGRVGVEAMCSGIPVIAHPTPGLRESLGDAGIFADRSDVDVWVAALSDLQDPKRWQAASTAALARADELNPTEDLAAWCDAIEATAQRGRIAA